MRHQFFYSVSALFIFFLLGGAIGIHTAAAADPNAGIEAQVEAAFVNAPVMDSIANCESGFRQFAPDGSVLQAGTGDAMTGIFQINDINAAAARELGYDITTVAGNIGYASYLYGAQGTGPWISSFDCWGEGTSTAILTTAATTTTTTSSSLTADLVFGAVGPQVLILQQMLNEAGFMVATSGPGSPGNETTIFGFLTRAAVENFQCVKGIACSGDEYTTGYGYVDAVTRAALAEAISASAAPATATTTYQAIATTTVATTSVAELAELQSRVAVLVAIVAQLEQELAHVKI